jgi:hypothetical protein
LLKASSETARQFKRERERDFAARAIASLHEIGLLEIERLREDPHHGET